jgi:hypothetical protein
MFNCYSWFDWRTLLIFGVTICLTIFVPSPFKEWCLGCEFLVIVILLIWIHIKIWLDDTTVYNHKRYRFFVGCKNQLDANQVVSVLNNLGHQTTIKPSPYYAGSFCVYVIWDKNKQIIMPWQVLKK